MTLIATDPFGAPAVRRNSRGQYLVAPPNSSKEKGYVRATTVVKALSQTDWGPRDLRFLAEGFAANPQHWADRVKECTEAWQIKKVVAAILDTTDCHAGRNHGTWMHDVIERMNRGEAPSVPIEYERDVDAYFGALEAAGVKVLPEYMERMIVVDDIGVGGMLDNIVKVPASFGPATCACTMRIADLKTGANTYDDEHAVQLHLYRRGTLYDQATGERTPLPEGLCEHWGLVIHLPRGEGRCQLHHIPLDLGAEGLRIALEARAFGNGVKPITEPEWTAPVELVGGPDSNGPQPSTTAPSSTPPAGVPAVVLSLTAPSTVECTVKLQETKERIAARVRALVASGHGAAMQANWPAGVPGLKADHDHSTAELDAIEAAVWRVEGQVGAPFPDEPVERPAQFKMLEQIRLVGPAVLTYEPSIFGVPGPTKVIDEGGPCTDEKRLSIGAVLQTLIPERLEWITAVTAEALAAGYSLSVSRNPTKRRYALACAVIALSDFWDREDFMRTLLAHVMHTDQAQHPTNSIAALITALTIDEATALHALINSDAIAADSTGAPVLVAA